MKDAYSQTSDHETVPSRCDKKYSGRRATESILSYRNEYYPTVNCIANFDIELE